jgi:anthranilate phosphoribosyltransferase
MKRAGRLVALEGIDGVGKSTFARAIAVQALIEGKGNVTEHGETALITKILGNEVTGGKRDWVVMNAAMILYAGGKAPSIRDAVSLAQEALASGAAKKKLSELAP